MKKCLAILAILAIGLTLPSCSKDNGQTPTLETEGTTTQGTSGTTSPSGGPADTTDTMENTSSSALDTTASTKTTSKTDSTSKNTTTDPITSPTASATETPTEPSAAPPPVTEPEPKMNVLVIGDSNTEYGHITGQLEEILEGNSGQYANGYRPLSANFLCGFRNGVYIKNDGKWTRHDMTDSNPPATASPCGIWISTETAGAATSVRFKGTGADFFYLKQPGGGVFTIEADGCETIRVDTSSDRLETGKASLRGMEAGKTNTVKLVAQSGKVTLQGFVQKGNECMEGVVHNWGNAAANSKQFAAIDETLFKTALKELDPDYVVILLGTNDGFAASAEVRYLSTIVQRVQSALPDAHILLTSTFDVDLPIPRQSMATYLTDGYPVVARNTGCAYWNMHDWFGPFDASRMLDACHCNDAGGRAIAEEMLKQLRALG